VTREGFQDFTLFLTRAFCSDARVKFAVSLLALLAFSFAACDTLATRRSLYSPAKASGPYTKYRKEGGKLPETRIPTTPVSDPLPQVDAPAGEPALP
jgi:hypothetical protein